MSPSFLAFFFSPIPTMQFAWLFLHIYSGAVSLMFTYQSSDWKFDFSFSWFPIWQFSSLDFIVCVWCNHFLCEYQWQFVYWNTLSFSIPSLLKYTFFFSPVNSLALHGDRKKKQKIKCCLSWYLLCEVWIYTSLDYLYFLVYEFLFSLSPSL
jgi:hypothetical protein